MERRAVTDPVAIFDGAMADRYDEGIRVSCPAYDALHRMIVPWLQTLPADAAILSAGAGTGAEILTLAQGHPGWRFVGVDASADMLHACGRRIAEAGIASAVELHHGPIEQYRAPALFDAASSIFVVNYIHGRERKLAYLRGIAANLKPGAPLVLADLHGNRASPEFVRLLRAWLLMVVAKGVTGENLADLTARILRDIAFVTESEVLELLAEAGFVDTVRFFQAFLFGGWVTVKAGA
jgi:tRNA (cmo5U34)-methyltransferase